jgi:hypothetical protein
MAIATITAATSNNTPPNRPIAARLGVGSPVVVLDIKDLLRLRPLSSVSPAAVRRLGFVTDP